LLVLRYRKLAGFFTAPEGRMSINVKNAEAERLVAELKRRKGVGTTDLLLDLLRRETARMEAEMETRAREGLEIDRRYRESWLALPVVDPRPFDEVLEWDENGLPR
jgi:hypothetical protein